MCSIYNTPFEVMFDHFFTCFAAPPAVDDVTFSQITPPDRTTIHGPFDQSGEHLCWLRHGELKSPWLYVGSEKNLFWNF